MTLRGHEKLWKVKTPPVWGQGSDGDPLLLLRGDPLFLPDGDLPFLLRKVRTKGSMRTNSSCMSSPSKGTHLPSASFSITMLYS